ncbi:hypothetical protein Hanom_Chr03g00255101 [Helianthus anomalus]
MVTPQNMEERIKDQAYNWKGGEGTIISHLCSEGDLESGAPFGGNFLEGFNVEREGGPQGVKIRNKHKKGDKMCKGQVKPKMVSMDIRPSSRKRARLDVDPSGLDPFGLNVLLGLHMNDKVSSERNNMWSMEGGYLEL